MATLLTAWTPEMLTQVVGVPAQGIKFAVRNAAIKFCEESLLWTYTLSRIDVVADTGAYSLTVPTDQNGQVVSIDNVKYKEDGQDDDQFRRLDPISETQQDLLDSGSWSFLSSSTPNNFYSTFLSKQLNFYQIPSEASAGGLLVKVNLRPTISCDDVPDFLYDDYREAVKDGALAFLFGSKAMPWYSLETSLYHRALFKDAYSDAKQDKITGPTKRLMQVSVRAWV
jgi:hypothetical protein